MLNTISKTTPKIFEAKNKLYEYNLSKKSLILKNRFITDVNYVLKSKHYPPQIREWVNSVYFYNKNNIKSFPSLDVDVYDLIKSYFNFYILKHNHRKKNKRRIRIKRSTAYRLIASKPNIKHTNDKVNVTIYTYDKSSSQYTKRMANILTIDKIKNYNKFFVNLKSKYLSLEHKLKKILKDKFLKKFIRNIIMNKYKLSFSDLLINKKSTENYNISLTQNKLNFILNNKISLLYLLNKKLGVVFNDSLNNYIKKVMRKDMVSIFYKRLLCFQQSKYQKQHAQLLTILLENIYKKKVVLDIVNLKYFYNNSSIFSSVVLSKLKKKKNKVIRVLNSALSTLNISYSDKVKAYSEMFEKKNQKKNVALKNLATDKYIYKNLSDPKFNDIVDISLCKDSYKRSINNNFYNTKKPQLYEYNKNLHEIMSSLKNKFTKGIRIETAGRLTKRNTAERSVYKLAYKGNIKDYDSSLKNIPTVLLRGHAKSNLVYTQSKSKVRVGSFGLKTWISSN